MQKRPSSPHPHPSPRTRTCLTDRSGRQLIEQIKANEADLDELDFTDSTWHLNEEQAFILAEALMTPNTVVKKLDLAMNQTLGDDGKVAISELLLDNLNCAETPRPSPWQGAICKMLGQRCFASRCTATRAAKAWT